MAIIPEDLIVSCPIYLNRDILNREMFNSKKHDDSIILHKGSFGFIINDSIERVEFFTPESELYDSIHIEIYIKPGDRDLFTIPLDWLDTSPDPSFDYGPYIQYINFHMLGLSQRNAFLVDRVNFLDNQRQIFSYALRKISSITNREAEGIYKGDLCPHCLKPFGDVKHDHSYCMTARSLMDLYKSHLFRELGILMRQALIGYEVQQETIAEKIFDIIYFLNRKMGVSLEDIDAHNKEIADKFFSEHPNSKTSDKDLLLWPLPANDDPY